MLARKWVELEDEEEYEDAQAPAESVRIKDPVERARLDYIQKQQAMLAVADKKRLWNKIMAMLLAAIMLVSFLIYQNSMIAAKGYDIVQARMQAAKLEAENASLKITNAHLKSPQRIKEIATTQLGMSIADKVYFAEQK